MKILYFSWIKDTIGKTSEEINVSGDIDTISKLISFLIQKNQNYKEAFSDLETIKYSINMETANINDKIKNDDEVAFFPPMTGG